MDIESQLLKTEKNNILIMENKECLKDLKNATEKIVKIVNVLSTVIGLKNI